MNRLRIRELVRKEFIQLFRDKRNWPILFIAPILQLLVFGYVVNYDIKEIRVALSDQSRTRESRMLADAFTASNIFRIVRASDDPGQVEDALLAGDVDLAIKIGPDFSSLIRQGKTAAVQILSDGSMSNMAALRLAYISTILDNLNRTFIRELYPQQMTYGRIDGRIRTWYNANLDSQNFFVPGIVAFLIMLISLLLTSMAIIREKEAGTMEQLIVTPVKSIELIAGKTIPYIAISLTQMTVVTAIAVLWFKIPLTGSVVLIFFSACIFLLSTLGIGLFISTISATQQQAMMTTFFFIVPFFMLSGFVFPIANMPEIIQWLTYVNPLRYFLVIIRGVFLKGVGLEVLWPQLFALTIIGTIVFSGAIIRFRKRLD
ncbi:MAG: ABC transporter permease [Deltaproteobacteria bacterium]|nr:ABC transporter permease [Deltaproteobacteria bacterium]